VDVLYSRKPTLILAVLEVKISKMQQIIQVVLHPPWTCAQSCSDVLSIEGTKLLVPISIITPSPSQLNILGRSATYSSQAMYEIGMKLCTPRCKVFTYQFFEALSTASEAYSRCVIVFILGCHNYLVQ
jgi:hypothetical protein